MAPQGQTSTIKTVSSFHERVVVKLYLSARLSVSTRISQFPCVDGSKAAINVF